MEFLKLELDSKSCQSFLVIAVSMFENLIY